jgi:hypothetical protein
MEARFFRAALLAAGLFVSLGASYRTQHFIVSAGTPELAREIAEAAETYRRDLAVEWLGRELPEWSGPCPIRVQSGSNIGAGGATSFTFIRGRPHSWQMSVQGSRERILDSVLPHEVTHTIFATHFGRPLPRWADEGACTTVEHHSERAKQERMLLQFLHTDRGIAFNRMFAMTEYPSDIMPLYSQGYSVVRFLIAQGGKKKFVAYLGEGMKTNNWTAATQSHYGYSSLSDLQVTWLDWVRRGSPAIRDGGQLASAGTAETPAAPGEPPARGGNAAAASTGDADTTSAGDRLAATPAAAARSATGSSWYARQASRPRDFRQAEPSASDVAAVPPSRGGPSRADDDSFERAVTRPPSAETPRQIILEWSRTPGAAPAGSPVGPPLVPVSPPPLPSAYPPPTGHAPPSGYFPPPSVPHYDPARVPGGTMWR